MGTLVTAAYDYNTKPNYTIATVAAGSVSPADGNLYLFVGTTADSQVEAYDGMVAKCRQALREAGWPNPVTLEFSYATYDLSTYTLVVANGAAPTLTENQVAVIQGLDFSVGAKSNSTHVKRMWERYREAVGNSETLVAAPVFSGPIGAQSWTQDVEITPLDVSSYFGSPNPAAVFTVSAGALPPGLSLNAVTGIVSGTPTTADTGVFTFTATNEIGSDDSGSIAWTVSA